ETMWLKRIVNLAPIASSLDANRTRRGVNMDPLHGRKIDHDAIITDSKTGDVVPGPAHGKKQVLATGEVHRLDDVSRATATGDEPRPPIDGGVENRARCFVLLIVRENQLAVKTRFQFLNSGRRRHRALLLLVIIARAAL